MKTSHEAICRHFQINSEATNVYAFGSGHIHDTFKVETGNGNFILQKINQKIFKDIEGLTLNIRKVSDYLLHDKSVGAMQNLRPIPLISGLGNVYFDSGKEAWRMFHFIEASQTFDQVLNPAIALEGGRAFGAFLRSLSGFPVDDLIETIPGFHDVAFRLDNFLKAIENDLCYRVEFVAKEIEFIFDRAKEMERQAIDIRNGLIPRRVAHNDTKVNNVLFDENQHAICVIDLDTLMPGYSVFDFGDAIRTFGNLGKEDDKNLKQVRLSMENFTAFAQGYLSETKSILTYEELENLAFGARYITYEQSLRFLLDYIEGDWYYKVKYPEHNLVRARAQIQLLRSMEDHFDDMQKIVKRFSA